MEQTQTETRTTRKDALKRTWRRELLRLWLLTPGILALAFTMLARANPDVCEHVFSRNVYPLVSSIWGYLPSLVSFSVAQWVVIIVVVSIACMLIYYIVRIIGRGGERLRYLYRMVTSFLAVLSIAFFLYATLCGLNYYRLTFAQNEGFDVRSPQRRSWLTCAASSRSSSMPHVPKSATICRRILTNEAALRDTPCAVSTK